MKVRKTGGILASRQRDAVILSGRGDLYLSHRGDAGEGSTIAMSCSRSGTVKYHTILSQGIRHDLVHVLLKTS
jgi:hypothetical protein